MKRVLLYMLLLASAVAGASAQEAIYVYRNDGGLDVFTRADIDSITYSRIGADDLYHADWQMQLVHTPDSTYRIPFSVIDSVVPTRIKMCPDDHHPHLIDLGLPNGTKWSCCNVDAPSPEGYGGYYAWGDTEEKSVYDWESYLYKEVGGLFGIGRNISDTQYDVAHVKWGDPWCMPTLSDMRALLNNSICVWIRQNGVSGILVTGPNGNCIFLPMAGHRWDKDLYNESSHGCYWSGTIYSVENYACGMQLSSEYLKYIYSSRSNGFSVRPVVHDVAEIKMCPDDHHPHMIDLGLPSGTKWSCCNVGASSSEESGGYYAWGETEEKPVYNLGTYLYYNKEEDNCVHIGDEISGTQYDVARVKWGDPWRMPSHSEILELQENCSPEWTRKNGIKGILVTGPNGNSVFLPAAGYRQSDGLHDEGSSGNFWSGLFSGNERYAYFQGFSMDGWGWGYVSRYVGYSVRPVAHDIAETKMCPDDHHPHLIDLGLPSGTKWSCCNVGASKPEGYGGYYAWGETEEKSVYNFDTYLYYNKGEANCVHIGDEISGTQYDAARVNWGTPWRIPTLKDMEELFNNCTREWTRQNGVNGVCVTGPNGNSVFLPAAGYRWGEDLLSEGTSGVYQQGTFDSGSENAARGLGFDSGQYWHWISDSRSCGHSIRPVAE